MRENERERERDRERNEDGEAVISQLPIANDTFPRSTIGSDYTSPRCSSPRYYTRANFANDRDQSASLTGRQLVDILQRA